MSAHTDWKTIINRKPTITESLECAPNFQSNEDRVDFLKCLIEDSRMDVVYLRQFLHTIDLDDMTVDGVLLFEYCIQKGNLVFLVEIINFMIADLGVRNHFSCLVESVMIKYINNPQLSQKDREHMDLYRADVIDCIHSNSTLDCLIPSEESETD